MHLRKGISSIRIASHQLHGDLGHLICHRLAGEREGVGSRQPLEQSEGLHLIVNDSVFGSKVPLPTFGVDKSLLAYARIPDSCRHRPLQCACGAPSHAGSCTHHGQIAHALRHNLILACPAAFFDVRSIRQNFLAFRQQVVPRNTNTAKAHVASVDGVVAHFVANVTTFNAWETVVIFIAELNKENMHPMLNAIDNELRIKCAMRCSNTDV